MVRLRSSGKIEIETLEDGREVEIIQHLIRQSILEVFRNTVEHSLCASLLDEFENGAVISAGDDIASTAYIDYVSQMKSFKPLLDSIGLSSTDLENPAHVASGIEFILEGLHLSKMLNKDAVGDAGVYRART